MRSSSRPPLPGYEIAYGGQARMMAEMRVTVLGVLLVGFLPLALALEAGGDLLQPMAAGAVGGLLMEIPVALVLMPCLYVLLNPAPRPAHAGSVTPR